MKIYIPNEMHSNNMVLHYRCNLVHNRVSVWNHQSSHHKLWNLALCSAFSLGSEPLTTVLLAVACLTLWHQGWKLPLHVNMNILSWNMQHFVEEKEGDHAACLRMFSKYTCWKNIWNPVGGGIGQLVSKGSTTRPSDSQLHEDHHTTLICW